MIFKELADEYLLTKRRKSKRTLESATYHVGCLVQFFGEMDVSEIRNKTWTKYEMSQPNRALNHDRLHLVGILLYAKREGYIQEVPHIPNYKPFKHPGFVVSFELFGEFLRRCKTLQERAIITLAFMMGMRRGEILKLTWDRVDLKSEFIVLRREDTKTRKERTIPIHPRCLVLLKELSLERNYGYVFRGTRSDAGEHYRDFQRNWRRIRGCHFIRFHDLRHSFITHAINQGLNPAKVSQFAGMGLQVLEKVYLHLQPENLRSICNLHTGTLKGYIG